MTTQEAKTETTKRNRDENVFVRWWRRYHREHKGEAADFARLRRCATPTEALLEPPAVELAARLDASRDKALVAAAIAVALAHVREDVAGKSLARQLGEKSDDRPQLSPIRFNRLMRADGLDNRLTALRRALAVVKGRADVAKLGRDLQRLLGFWGHDDQERAILDWTLAYHGAPLDAERAAAQS